MVKVLLKTFIVVEEYVKKYVSIWNESIIWGICLNVFRYDMSHDMIVISYV